MAEFTKEEQIQAIYDLKVGYTLGHADIEMLKSMARQLLAGLEQEPVAEVPEVPELSKVIYHFRDWNEGFPVERFKADYVISWMLANYPPAPPSAAPQLPQPAVGDIGEIRVGRLPTMNQDEYPGLGDWWVQLRIGEGSDEVLARVYGATPQEANARAEALARRAAMLQGAEPVSQPDELPMDYQQGHKDGLEWAARLAEANHPQTGDWLYDDPLELAKAIRKGPDMPVEPMQKLTFREALAAIRNLGPIDAEKIQAERDALNEPDVPDGYALVPVEMTPEQMRAVQLNSELGAYAAANLSGAYSLFREFWGVACSATGNYPATPEGYVLVPIEPTAEMCDVKHVGVDVYTGIAADEYYSIGGEDAAKVWKAMLAAAPNQEAK